MSIFAKWSQSGAENHQAQWITSLTHTVHTLCEATHSYTFGQRVNDNKLGTLNVLTHGSLYGDKYKCHRKRLIPVCNTHFHFSCSAVRLCRLNEIQVYKNMLSLLWKREKSTLPRKIDTVERKQKFSISLLRLNSHTFVSPFFFSTKIKEF